MNKHEAGFLEFIEEPNKRRLRTLFELGDKRRGDILSMLNHAIHLNPRYCSRLAGADQFAPTMELMLKKLGAPDTCYVIGGGELDGHEMPLGEALSDLIGFGDGAFVSCLPGKLAYYQYEGMNGGHLCQR
jgi:hypothetical protein